MYGYLISFKKISNYNNSTILENLVSAGLCFEEV